MSADWTIAMLFLLLHLAFASVSRLAHGSWLAPGPFFAGIWLLYLSLPMLLADEYFVWWGAILAIFFASLAVNTGSLLGVYVGRGVRVNSEVTNVDKIRMGRLLRNLLVISTFIGIASILLVMVDLGQGLRTLLSFRDLAEAAAQNSILRYQQDYSAPFVARILTTGVYFAPLSGGMLFAIANRVSWRLLSFLPLVPAVLWAMVMTTKASVLICVVLWLASFLAASLWGSDTNQNRNWRGLILKLFVLGVILGAFLILVQMMRYGDADLAGAIYVIHVLKVALLGYLAAFSTWLNQYLDQMGSATFGAYSFAGLYELLGLASREMGIYGDQSIDVGDSSTNVYTAFRSLIQDFTLAGALIVLVLIGFVAGFSFERLRAGNVAYVAIASLFYASVMWSHVTSTFAYNTIILAFLLWSGALIVSRRYIVL